MQTDDYYQTLGVSKTASQETIQKAYRQLARKYHPDFNQNDPKRAKENFQKVQEAFDVLGNHEKRQIYDQYGVSPDQMGTGGGHGPFQWSFAGGAPGRGTTGRGATGQKASFQFENIDDFMNLFGGGGFGSASPEEMFGTNRPSRQGRNIEQAVTIPFTLSITGGKINILMEGQTVSVTIPAGITDGKKIRLPGLGEAGSNGVAGNLMLTVHVEEHPYFSRRGNNLYVDVPISLKEAVFGAKIDVPSPKGNVTLTVPPGTSSGMKLRIKQCGVALPSGGAGDLFAILQVALPKNWSQADKELLEKLQTPTEEPIREKLRWDVS